MKKIKLLLSCLLVSSPILAALSNCSHSEPDKPTPQPTVLSDLLDIGASGDCTGFKEDVTQEQIDTVICSDTLELPKEIITICDKAFNYVDEDDLHIPSCVSTIILPENLTSIGKAAFRQNNHIQEVVFNKNLTNIHEQAFEYCISIKSLKFNEGLETIEANAFARCNGLTDIVLPNTIKNIGERAFFECGNLNKIDTSSFDNTFV